jgi:hypothetical protein
MERDDPAVDRSVKSEVRTDARPLEKPTVGKIGEGIYDAVLGRLRPMEPAPTAGTSAGSSAGSSQAARRTI